MMSYVMKTHRFGLLTPSSNTTQEPEFSAALPPSVSLHTGRVTYRDITPEEQIRCVLELEQESGKLADAEVDVVVFAATAPALVKGKGYDRELIRRMEDASGRPATTAATAFIDALTLLGAKTIAIGAPWSKTMDKLMVEFMEANGFTVVHSEVAGFVASIDLGRADPNTPTISPVGPTGPTRTRSSCLAATGPRCRSLSGWRTNLASRFSLTMQSAFGRARVYSKEATALAATANCCATILPRERARSGKFHLAPGRSSLRERKADPAAYALCRELEINRTAEFVRDEVADESSAVP